MKDDILKRAMFAMPLSKASRGSGIMAGVDGFEEDINAMDEEDEMPSMARTPQNPEILMNNLRGDMRSVDARYEELAQMVGDEAAMATPPEVMAMLMGQMGQQGGIGALPQGAAMPPPPMPGAPPTSPMAAAPAAPAAPAMPAPAAPAPPAMPSGMGGAPPFPQGGVSQTPPAPVNMAVGGLLSKGAQALKGSFGRGAQSIEDLVGRGATRADELLGNYTMSPQPTISPMMGLDGKPVYLHGRDSLRQSPSGAIAPGEGTRFTAGQSLQDFRSPTFTGGMKQGIGEARSALEAFSPTAGRVVDAAEKVARPVGAMGLGAALSQTDAAKRMFTTPAGSANKDLAALVSQIPSGSGPGPSPRGSSGPEEIIIGSPYSPGTSESLSRESRANEILAGETDTSSFDRTSGDRAAGPAGSSGTSTLADSIKKAVGKKSYSDRVKEGYAELQPLFAEFLGEDKEAAKGNALLLIADAAFKLAGNTEGRTFGESLSKVVGDLPRGFASISAQDRDRALKVKSAALSGAMERVGSEDKYEQALNIAGAKAAAEEQKQIRLFTQQRELETIKGANAVNLETFKNANRTGKTEDAGVGGVNIILPNGGFGGFALRPEALEKGGQLHSIATSPNSIDPNSPFVDNYGPAPGALVEDKAQRLNIAKDIASDDRTLALIAQAKTVVSKVYGPQAFLSDFANNVFVPLGVLSPNIGVSDATITLRNIFNQMSRESAGENGRVSNQGQQWARDTLKQLDDPTAFWKDASLAANALNNREAEVRNQRYASGSQLGVGTDNLVMRTVPLGIETDPFRIPNDPAKQGVMVNWLKANIGSKEDQGNTRVWVKFPTGQSVSLSPQQIRDLKIQ